MWLAEASTLCSFLAFEGDDHGDRPYQGEKCSRDVENASPELDWQADSRDIKRQEQKHSCQQEGHECHNLNENDQPIHSNLLFAWNFQLHSTMLKKRSDYPRTRILASPQTEIYRLSVFMKERLLL